MKKETFRRRTWNAFDVINLTLLLLFAIIILYPFYNSILVSIVPQYDYIRTPFMIYPKRLDLSSYKYIIQAQSLFTGMRVTTLITLVGVVYNMILTVICAYCLAKPFPGRKIVNYGIVFTMYFSGGLIPSYLLIKNLGLIDSIFSMILPTGITYMYMIVIRNHFLTLPAELEESAKIDGANEMTILFRIVLPLSLPILATFTLYYGVDRWNEWWNGMLYIKTVGKQPLQLVLRNIIMDVSSNMDSVSAAGAEMPFDEGIKMASTIVSMLPIMLLYPFLQRYFVSGLTIGAVKG